jgi:hypothetical protein
MAGPSARLDPPGVAVGDARELIFRGAPVVLDADHVGRVEGKHRRRQREGRLLASDPFLEERPPRAALGGALQHGDLEALGADASSFGPA